MLQIGHFDNLNRLLRVKDGVKHHTMITITSGEFINVSREV